MIKMKVKETNEFKNWKNTIDLYILNGWIEAYEFCLNKYFLQIESLH